MLINLNEVKDKLNKIRTGEITEGKKVGIPEIDNYIRFKEGNFNVILGHANVGKTTVILYLMLLYAKRLNIRWLVFSSENEPHSIYRKLVEFLEHKPITQVTEAAFEKQMGYINDFFKVVDNNNLYTYRNIVEIATSYKKAWDYGGLLIDPYNSLIKDPSIMKSLGGHEYDYQATTEIRKFCKTYNVSTWLNTHANTAALRQKHPVGHEYAGHPIPPMASDVEGGGKFVNRADDFVVIHRYIQHPADWMQSHIHVRKVKEIETGGKPTSIDEPIRFRSIVGNVGFEIDGQPILEKPIKEEFKPLIE
jgi:energy-coupling factor transporter ATP-binding protein EcfA2